MHIVVRKTLQYRSLWPEVVAVAVSSGSAVHVYSSEKSGAVRGTCAGGFGVCCVFSIGCGGSSIENTTYLTTGTQNRLRSLSNSLL